MRRKRPAVKAEGANQIRPRDSTTVHLDGSTLEGGGQLVRVALTLSALTGIPVHITRIRAGRGGGRSSGGLKESHLAALEVLAKSCGADVEGGFVGSRELLFEPKREKRMDGQNRRGEVELQKPGSVWLILQALLPWYLLREGCYELWLRGGTNVSSSMSGDYVQQVLLPVLKQIGLPKVEVDVVQRGWAGNAPQIGEVKVLMEGCQTDKAVSEMSAHLRAFTVHDRGTLAKVSLAVVAHPESMRSAIISQLREEVTRKFPKIEVQISVDEDSHDIRRLYILLVAHTSNGWRLGRDYLGTGKALKSQKEIDALVEASARKVTVELLKEVEAGGCVDEYMQDQLVVFQALATGISSVDAGRGREEGTLHTQTVRWVCQEMLGGLGFEVIGGGGCVGKGTGSSDNLKELQEAIDEGNGKDKRSEVQLAEEVLKMNWEESEK